MSHEPEYCDICEREVSILEATLGGGMCHDCAVMYEKGELICTQKMNVNLKSLLNKNLKAQIVFTEL